MYRQIYSLVFNLASPITIGRLIYRSQKAAEYGCRVSERFAISRKIKELSKERQGRIIWVHAVSVGEVMAAIPLIDQLMAAYPEDTILVTTMTPTGSACVLQRWGEKVKHLYLPYDFAWAIKRFVLSVSPSLLIIMETELWPNLVHYVSAIGCPVFVANARLSEKSAKGYSRFGPLVREMLQSLTIVGVQAEADGERFIKLGLPRASLEVTGSIKFDFNVDQSIVLAGKAVRERLARPIFIAASTHAGEDELILEAFKEIKVKHPELLLVLVPRHPERFDEVVSLCCAFGWQVGRRTLQDWPQSSDDIFVGDTMGELLLFYAMSHVAFVGGSLVATGGHNVLEPIAMNVPVITGPHMFNFQYVKDELEKVGGIETASSPKEIALLVDQLLAETTKAAALVANASRVLVTNRGALERHGAIINRLLNL